MAFIVQVNL